MNILTFITLFVFIAGALICIGFALARFKASRFVNDCIYLEELIDRSEVSGQAYDDINRCYNDLDCTTVADEKRKRSIWSRFQFKFKSLSPYKVKE
jgi:hypothetical protein